MTPWREQLLEMLLFALTTVAAGAVIMIVHGLLIHRRLRGVQPLSECVTSRAATMALVAGVFSVLFLTQAREIPWQWFGSLALLVATAQALLPWLGPPEEHVQACTLCKIGKGCAYSHHYGYLMFMQKDYGIRKRLEEFRLNNRGGMARNELDSFYSAAVVVPLPRKEEYSRGCFANLKGIGRQVGEVPGFRCNNRTYPTFKVHEVTSSRDGGSKHYVAMDSMDALVTLQKLRQHSPVGLSAEDCEKQIKEFMDEIEKIVRNCGHLRGQLKVVRYDPDEHVGDAVIAAVEGGGL